MRRSLLRKLSDSPNLGESLDTISAVTRPPNPSRPNLSAWTVVRALAYAWFGAVLATTALVALGCIEPNPDTESTITIATGAGITGLILAIALWLRPGANRALRILDLVLGNTLLTLITLELATFSWTRLFPSPFAWDAESVQSRIDAHRLVPGSELFGFRINSQGYHDDEFFTADDDALTVALVADSFGVGVVPHTHNFATVAEDQLRASLTDRFDRVAIHNLGVPSIGLAQYVHLVEHEVPRYRPSFVVVCIFVGNDIMHHGLRRRRSRFSTLQRWLFWQVGTRIAIAQAAQESTERLASIGTAHRPTANSTGPAWLDDPNLEPATLSEQDFWRIQTERLEVTSQTSDRTERRFQKAFEALDYLQRRLDERLLVLLIPDEFQVDDDQWNQLLASVPQPESYDRDAPQRRLVAHCDRREIAVVDTLPALREHVRSGGPRPYHLRDTHWNATGNRIAGELLARTLLSRLTNR